MKNNFVIWLIGLSGSGKTTLGKKLYDTLKNSGINNVDFIDGDEIRNYVGNVFGYSIEERRKNIRVVQYLIYKLYVNGINVVVANLSPFEDLRKSFRLKVPDYIEVFLDCGIEECKKRDPKGLYKKVEAGSLNEFMGIHQKYDMPSNSDIVLNTSKYSLEESKIKLITYLKEHLYI